MHRFFTTQLHLNKHERHTLTDPNEIHHLKNVLRHKIGDEVTLFNNSGEEVLCEIIKINTSAIELKFLRSTKTEDRKPLTIILACAIPKKAKFETIIEKTTELGVDEIIPLLTARTEVRLTGERALQKAERFRKVAVNAAKQCRRTTVPTIHAPATLGDVLKNYKTAEARILIPCLCGERKKIFDVLQNNPMRGRLIVLIGPEGDFTEAEVQNAKEAGAIPVSLGETVLKVDTAAISVMAAIRFILEKSVL